MKAIVASMELLIALPLFSVAFLTFISGAVSSQLSARSEYTMFGNTIVTESVLQGAVFLAGGTGMNLTEFRSMAGGYAGNVTAVPQNGIGAFYGSGRLVVLRGKIYAMDISR